MNSVFITQLLAKFSKGEKILDLGCGNGEFLEILVQKGINAYGVDINSKHILTCIEKGLSVFQGNLDQGLSEFSDKSFDYVILSLTLQQVQNPIYVMKEMLRIGKRIIISFPNFAYWKSRIDLLIGKAPETKELPYAWHNTPNIRVITIKDFYALCHKEKFKIVEEYGINPNNIVKLFLKNRISNFFSTYGLFVVEK